MADFESMDVRLKSIEDTLKDLKNVVLESKLQKKDIEILAKNIETTEKQVIDHEKRISTLEGQDDKNKAEKWKYITDYIFKAAVVSVGAYFLSKLGL